MKVQVELFDAELEKLKAKRFEFVDKVAGTTAEFSFVFTVQDVLAVLGVVSKGVPLVESGLAQN